MDDQPIDASADAAAVLDEPASLPEPLAAPEVPSSNGAAEPPEQPQRRPRRRWLLALVLVPVVAVVLAMVAWAVDSSRGGVPRNVRLGGMDVGGLSDAELMSKVSALAEDFGSTPIRITAGEHTYDTTAAELGLMLDDDASADNALHIEDDTFILVRPFEWMRSFVAERDASLTFQVNDEQVASTIVELQGDDRIAPTEPAVTLVDGTFSLVAGVDGSGVDPVALAERLQQVASETPLGDPIRLTVDPGPIAPLGSDEAARAAVSDAEGLLAEPVEIETDRATRTIEPDVLRTWATLVSAPDGTVTLALDPELVDPSLRAAFEDVEGHPVDATVTLRDGRPVILDDRPGVVCCAEGAAATILSSLRAGERTVELSLVDGPPSLTSEDAAAWKITQAVGGNNAWRDGAATTGPPGFTTYHDPTGARIINIHRIADIVRGAVVPPGGSFSVNAFVGKRTAEKGFVAAGAIRDGMHVDELGGGISQFATTLFNAAYFAGLDIDEYQAHSEWFRRYPRGREATMGYPAPDLRFTNNTPYGILIWTSYTQTSLTVTLYSSPWATAEQTAISESPAGRCTVVVTTRTRTYPDGHTETDKFRARYRPGEGESC